MGNYIFFYLFIMISPKRGIISLSLSMVALQADGCLLRVCVSVCARVCVIYS